ncbi:MGMT family protein [Deltaproteobacteria bacterium PRO3]|nr:MGMT family protein [Deltaproteobacteria bacterium PRO3]
MRSSTAGKARTPKTEGESFAEKVLAVVAKIPRGKVLTYGQVATLVGSPRAARIVGGVLFRLGPESRLPWQRVINAQGKLSTYRVGSGPEQRRRLEAEGLKFNREGAVDLKRHQWWPPERLLKAWELDEDLVASIHRRFGW